MSRGRTFLSVVASALLLAAVPIAGQPAGAAHVAPAAAVPAGASGTKVLSLSAALNSTCAVLVGGVAKCWGANASGELGYGDLLPRGLAAHEMGDHLPAIDLGTGRKVTAISVAATHTCAILDNSKVKCWGQNNVGQLGIGTTTNLGGGPNEMGNALPVLNLGTGRKVKSISTGYGFGCAVLDNGKAKCWGDGSSGELGYGDTNARGDAADEMGDNLPDVPLGTGRKVKSISAGYLYACAVLDNGKVKCWGVNNTGQLGLGDVIPRGTGVDFGVPVGVLPMGDGLPSVDLGPGRKAKSVATGWFHTCAVLDNGKVKCWGLNNTGQLGYGDHEMRGDAANEMGANLHAVDLGAGRKAKSVVAGIQHSCALLDNGSVKCWGLNDFGQIGRGSVDIIGDGADEMGSSLPVVDLGTGRTAKSIVAGARHTCALLDNNTVKCWGAGGAGFLGYGDNLDRGDGPNEMGDFLPAVNLGVRVKSVSSGFATSCAILENNTLECWGENSRGQLGYGNTTSRGDSPAPGHDMGDSLPTVNLGTGRTVRSVSVGQLHVCAILDNKALKCWGDNRKGQLGYGNTTSRGDSLLPGHLMGDELPTVDLGTGRTATAVVAGAESTCALLDNKTVKCWGSNRSGLLGSESDANWGDDPLEMGDHLPVVNLGSGKKVKALDLGYTHACAILTDGSLRCWGDNRFGQLGLGDVASRGLAVGTMGNSLPKVNVGTRRKVLAVSVGYDGTCAILDNRTLKCWGSNGYGQLGYGGTAPVGYGPNQMGDDLAPVDLGTGRKAQAVAVGIYHACVLLDSGSVKCWGTGEAGLLGYGDIAPRGVAPEQLGDFLPTVSLGTDQRVTAISGHYAATCALIATGMVKCWGWNEYGQLGIGDTGDRGDNANEMGFHLPAVPFTG